MRSKLLNSLPSLAALLLLVGTGCASYDAALDGGAPSSDDDDFAGDDDDNWDDDDDIGGDCQISGTAPVDGDPTAYYRDPVQVFFAGPVDWAELDLVGPDGPIVGATTLSDDGLTLSFDPFDDDPSVHLEPLAEYHAAVEGPGCTASWSFTTSVLGTPLDDDLPAGATYYVELGFGELLQPVGAESLMELIELRPFLLSVTEVDGDQIGLRAAPMDDISAEQACAMTVEVTETVAATLDGSHLSLPVTTVDLPVEQELWGDYGQQWLPMMQLTVEAEFSPNGQSISHGRLSGVIDGFDVDTLLGLMSGQPDLYAAGTTCDLLDKLGSPCEACPGHPEQQSCVSFVLDGAQGYWHDDNGLDPLEDEADLDGCND